MLKNHKQEWMAAGRMPQQSRNQQGNNRRNPGISFFRALSSECLCFLKGTNNSFFPEITYRLCNIKGHYLTHCPVAISTQQEVTMYWISARVVLGVLPMYVGKRCYCAYLLLSCQRSSSGVMSTQRNFTTRCFTHTKTLFT